MKGGEKVGEKRSGEPFGEMALLDGYPRSTTVIATEDTECLVMTRWDFTAELKSSNSIALSMLPELSKIIRRLEGESIP
jgi:CRP/FNR family transcriptional regulator/CRP/FNR family cyclic AMP-dependent transcriptional regulator